MGIFDFLRARTPDVTDKNGITRTAVPKEVARWAEKAAEKRAQNYDRQEAIAALADLGTPEAAAALLKRFNFIIDPTITDQEEKQMAYEGIISVGRPVLDPVRRYVERAESVAWPMKIVRDVLSAEEFVGELLDWLQRWDTEYAKFIDPKIQILTALEQVKDSRVRERVDPFLYDVNETARFHAVGAILAQEDDAAVGRLVETFCDEESVRIRARICEGFIERGWKVPEPSRVEFRRSMPSDFAFDEGGTLRRK